MYSWNIACFWTVSARDRLDCIGRTFAWWILPRRWTERSDGFFFCETYKTSWPTESHCMTHELALYSMHLCYWLEHQLHSIESLWKTKSRHHQLCTKMRSIPERIGPETTSRQSSTSTYSRPKVQEPRNCRLGWRTMSNFTPPRHVLKVELIEFMGQATEDTRRGKFVNDRLLPALYKSWAHAKRDAWCKQHTVPHTVDWVPNSSWT